VTKQSQWQLRFACAAAGTTQMAPMQQFEMVSETAVHQRYLTVYDRRIKFCAHDNPAEVTPAAKYCCFHSVLLSSGCAVTCIATS
jgi:hypothetical protein